MIFKEQRPCSTTAPSATTSRSNLIESVYQPILLQKKNELNQLHNFDQLYISKMTPTSLLARSIYHFQALRNSPSLMWHNVGFAPPSKVMLQVQPKIRTYKILFQIEITSASYSKFQLTLFLGKQSHFSEANTLHATHNTKTRSRLSSTDE